MTPAARKTLDELRSKVRRASVATVGGFRPPDDPLTSWFCRGVGAPDEMLPSWNGEPMFPLLQVRVSELPFVPEQLAGIELLVLFFSLREFPFDSPHGEGWLIREYRSLDSLVPLPAVQTPYRPFPVRWSAVGDDAPGWEDAWECVDLSAVNADDTARDAFFDEFARYPHTKFGGYPFDIQGGVGLDDFVFQVASEEKVRWVWVDGGLAYFFRSPQGQWSWSCRFD